MAGFQAVGMTHSSYPTGQQTSHHFHAHHHLHHHHNPHQHQQTHRSPPSTMECLASASPSSCGSSSISASGPAPSSSAKPRFFSAVASPASTEDFDQSSLLASCSTRQRNNDESVTSNRLRSEWVTLSKAMLMVLVEKICQLSFESDAQTTIPMTGVEPATQRPSSSSDVNHQTSTVVQDNRANETIVSQALVASELDTSITPIVSPSPPSSARSFPPPPPLVPICDAPSEAPRSNDDSIRASEASVENDSENTLTSVAEPAETTTMPTDAEPSAAACNSVTASLNRKRDSRRTHAKPARGGGCRGRASGKREDASVVEKREDKLRGTKLRPLRQRNCHRTTVQPWVACNKSLVYSMIDSALGATELVAPPTRHVVVTSPAVTLETGIVRCRAEVSSKDVNEGGVGLVNQRGRPEQPKKPSGASDVACDAPLLGALLSCDDVGFTNKTRDIPAMPTPPSSSPPPLLRQQHLLGSSSLKAIRRIGSTWHRTTFAEELAVPNPLCRSRLSYNGRSAQMVDHSFVASPAFSTQVRQAEDLTSGRPAPRHFLPSNTAFSGKRISFDAPQTGSNVLRLSSSDRAPSQLDLLLMQSRLRETRSKTSSVAAADRPCWIALDKDEVRSLVDSLVSTMMTSDDDVTKGSVAKRRGASLHGNVVHSRSLSDDDAGRHDNDETESQRPTVTGNDSGRHDNGRLVATDSGRHEDDSGRHDNCDDNGRLVAGDSGRYDDDDDDATIEYGRFVGMGFGRHDDGQLGEHWRSRAMQCLSTDRFRDYPVVGPGSVARDNGGGGGGECSSERGVSEGLARSMLKWKSSMLMRLHSQSQDEEK